MFCPGLTTEDMAGPLTGGFLVAGPAFATETEPLPFDGLFEVLIVEALDADKECEVDIGTFPPDNMGAVAEGSIRGGVEGTPG